MTQSQIFLSVTSICAWAGSNNGLQFLGGDNDLPYIGKDGLYYYFGLYMPEREYRLIMVSSSDIGVEK